MKISRFFSMQNSQAEALNWIGVRLEGGLGNQLFQYAAAKSVAERQELSVKFDTSKLESYGERTLELAPLLSDDDSLVSIPKARPVFKENGFAYQEEVFQITAGTWLEGYFQSWKYFEHSANLIRQIIANANVPTRAVSHDRFVAVQVRRGDYLNPEQLKFHGICGINYYQRALETVRQVMGDIPAVVFSDDPEVAEFFSRSLPNAVADKPSESESSLTTLRAIASGSAHIIANSSFGWWGSWLSEKSDLTIAPRPWFNETTVNTVDLLPPHWLTLDKS